MRFFMTAGIIALYAGPTLIGLGMNYSNPNLGTAMGVAYLSLLGLILGLLGTAVASLLSWRKTISLPPVWILLVSFAVSLGVFLLANSGALSRV